VERDSKMINGFALPKKVNQETRCERQRTNRGGRELKELTQVNEGS